MFPNLVSFVVIYKYIVITCLFPNLVSFVVIYKYIVITCLFPNLVSFVVIYKYIVITCLFPNLVSFVVIYKYIVITCLFPNLVSFVVIYKYIVITCLFPNLVSFVVVQTVVLTQHEVSLVPLLDYRGRPEFVHISLAHGRLEVTYGLVVTERHLQSHNRRLCGKIELKKIKNILIYFLYKTNIHCRT